MSINTAIVIKCDGCSYEEERPVKWTSIVSIMDSVLDELDEAGWLLGDSYDPVFKTKIVDIPVICPDCRPAEERYRRADAMYPSMV